MSFEVARRSGTAAELHGRPIEAPLVRRAIVLEPERTALVLGSTQPAGDVDDGAAAAQGVEVCRRRSGGGAVLLVPGDTTWVDVEIGRDDPLWDDDVGRSFHWLGQAWVDALAELGVHADVHLGPMISTPWSKRVCFAGLGPGEVTTGGRKVVGISQRRTRDGARFQCVVHRRWDPAPLLGLLALAPGERTTAQRDLGDAAAGVDADAEAVTAALVRSLP